MRNINELIGIIKGINFDGVINDKEVVNLQSWVDKNRNLTYEPRQVELIKLVDSVLEDHAIDDEERKLLLNYSEEFLRGMSDNTDKIYELNGIIEGIVCDGEVNKAEVYHLKEWMDEYGDFIRNYKTSADLCKAVDDILEDGVVSEEEQQQLLDMLADRIKNSQFETKLNYLCNQVKVRKNIGIELINILDNETAMHEIHKRAEAQLIRALSSYSSYIANQEIIVVSLVLIAMLEYDGNYYRSVRDTYHEVYRRYSEQKVEGLIRSILGRYKKQSESGSRSRIINVALENAIVPKAFLPAFFEFIFDIYKLNFGYDLPEEPYEDFKFVFEGLRNNMLSDGDVISINVTQKTYKLIATTKQLITKEDGMDAIIKLSILIVKLIDKRFWNKEIEIYNSYLKAGYEGWEKQLKDTSRVGHEHRRGYSHILSRWEPKFMMANNTVYLIPPTHKVKAQYDYRNIAVVVSNGEEELYRNNWCDIREIIGGYQINAEKIVIEKPLGNLTYRLVVGNEIIYDSKSKLYRNCVVFNGDGQEINNNSDYEGTAYFCYRAGEIELQNIVTKEYYCIGYKLVRLGDAIGVGRDIFNFSSMVKAGVYGQLHRNCFIQHENYDNYLPVFKVVNVILFEADNISNKFEIVINGKSKKLSEMQYKDTYRETITKYVVELHLEKSGFYTIEVNQLTPGKKVRILKEAFVYDAELEYNTTSVDDRIFRAKIVSGIIDDIIDTEIRAEKFDIGFIKFEIGGEVYSYLLPFDLGFYRIDERYWQPVSSELWINDISLDSVMTLYDSECDGLLVYTEDGVLAEDDIVLQDKGFYKQVAIGFLNSYKTNNRYVLLVFTVDGKKKYATVCYNKCVMEEENTEVLFLDNPKQVMITPAFHGKNKVFFEVFNVDGKKVYQSKALSSGQTEAIVEFNSFEEYTINFHEKTKILMLRKNTLLLQVKRIFYAKQDFVGRIFKIDEAYFNQSIKGVFVEKVYRFNKVYVRIEEILEEGIFRGDIFVKTFRGEWSLDGINPVEIEVCSEIIDDTLDIYITNAQYGDGLLLDFAKHGILNSLEHPTAPDIFLYTISTKGEMQS